MKPEQSTSALIAIFKDALNHSNETPALKYKRGIPDAAIDASLKDFIASFCFIIGSPKPSTKDKSTGTSTFK